MVLLSSATARAEAPMSVMLLLHRCSSAMLAFFASACASAAAPSSPIWVGVWGRGEEARGGKVRRSGGCGNLHMRRVQGTIFILLRS